VKTLGVDEHIWRPSMRATNKAVTIMVDLTRDENGCLHAGCWTPWSAGPARSTPTGSPAKGWM
jgi:hypothetical protein